MLIDQMELRVNPGQVIIAGENSFLGLSETGGMARRHWASHWRVLWSEVGSGHVLLLDSDLVEGLQLLADNAELARFLQENVECFLHEPFGDRRLPIIPAVFRREGSPPSPTSEIVNWSGGSARLTWSEFSDPFSFSAAPGFKDRPIGHHTTFFPASSASLVVNERAALGRPWSDERGKRSCTSACLAWCETWYRPEPAHRTDA